MDSEAKNVDITKTEDELEMEIRHKLFDALIEDYENYKIYGDSGMKRPVLNRCEFLFGCTGSVFYSRPERAWFFYFVDKLVLMIKINNVGQYGEYFKVFEYRSLLSHISIYDISKIVFKNLTGGQLYNIAYDFTNSNETYKTLENSDLNVDKLIYGRNTMGHEGMHKWFNLLPFQFEEHINNGYITDRIPNFNQGRGDMSSIIMTIRSHIRKMIEKNEQKRMQDLIQELQYEEEEWSIYYGNQFEDIDSQFEKQSKIISLQESQITNMNGIILNMQSQIEEQSKIIVNQQSKMEGIKKIMTNMLREQQSMSRQLEEQSKIIESLQEKKKIEQSTLDTDIDLILNGEI